MDDFRQLTGLDQATSDDTITLARTAAEAIRGLNWLTGREAGLGQPSAAYDVIGALALAASRLGQAFTQITRWLDQALAAGRLAQSGLAAGEPVQAADRLGGGAGQGDGVVAGGLVQVDELPEVIHGRPPRLLGARPAPAVPAARMRARRRDRQRA